MNRHERRAARKRGYSEGSAINISIGQLSERDPNYGSPAKCYLCSTPHLGKGIARIDDSVKRGSYYFPLCDGCNTPDKFNDITRKYFGSPDMTFHDGGELSREQLEAVWERSEQGGGGPGLGN